ncbi:MAG: chemotaxis protein CheA [Actinomycetota bacterium]|nr:chemotaxis protein CheA [Actinomycetota bacterium]
MILGQVRDMDVSQYKELFVTESQEYLATLNEQLLELENDPDNLELVTEIFRAAHTLKGMSATMGYDQLTGLAHEMENVLDQLRSGERKATPEIMDMLFSCLDTLGAMVEDIARDEPGSIDASQLVSALRTLRKPVPAVAPEADTAAHTPGGKRGTEEASEASLTAKEGTAAQRGEGELELDDELKRKYGAIPGVRILSLRVELDDACVLKSVRVFMIFKKLAQLGEVIASRPPMKDLEEEKFGYSFEVMIATRELPANIRKTLLSISEVKEANVEIVQEATAKEKEAKAPEKATEKAPISVAKKMQSVRVNISRLDKLMNRVGELVINRTRVSEIASGLETPELRAALDQTARLIEELQDEVMKTRMVPVEQIFNRFPRMVRDLAREQGKEIDFVVEGKEIELDRTILDEISDSLMHMLRNAVDHGIKTPEERKKRGKPPRGTVRLAAYRDRNYVAIEVEDDGEGINCDDVFTQAVKEGLISEQEVGQLSKSDLLRIISMPGFSTSAEVSGVSGRGVGMDVVRNKTEKLGGYVILESEPLKGTKITLRLPLALAIVQALMVEVAGEVYAVPMGTVRETSVVVPEDIRTVQNQEVIFLREETIPLLRLDQLLGCGHVLNGTQSFPVVINEVGPKLVALGVHSLIGQQEIVIGTLDEFLKGIEGFAGATILGTGRVALILDVPSLVSGMKKVGGRRR